MRARDELLTYRRAAKSVAELELGDLSPLNESIPELSGLHPMAQASPKDGRGEWIRTTDPQTPSLVR